MSENPLIGNPLVGTWRLNVEKSSFVPGPAHAKQTIKFVQVDNGLHVTTTIHNADGTTTITDNRPAGLANEGTDTLDGIEFLKFGTSTWLKK